MRKSRLYASIGTALFGVAMILLLLFTFMPVKDQQPDDEGVMVSFGSEIDDLGFEEMIAVEEQVQRTEPTSPLSEEENLLKQDEDDMPIIPPKSEVKKKTPTPNLEPQAKPKVAPQPNSKETQQNVDNLLGEAFSNKTSAGAAEARGRKGNPAGKGTSNGHSWSLSGRSLLSKIATPSYTSNVEGKITIAIRVDASGKVVGASVSSPTNISDSKTRNAAVRAARQTKFSAGSGISMGTITYHFKLN